jgi:hypothetical protein
MDTHSARGAGFVAPAICGAGAISTVCTLPVPEPRVGSHTPGTASPRQSAIELVTVQAIACGKCGKSKIER